MEVHKWWRYLDTDFPLVRGAPGVETIHADKHVLTFRGSDLWEGNDGGLYVSSNGGVNWTNKTDGIVHSLQYKIGVSQSDDKVISGLQDNGTKLCQEPIGKMCWVVMEWIVLFTRIFKGQCLGNTTMEIFLGQ